MTPAESLPPGTRVVDCDVHAIAPSIETLFPFLDDHWREIATTTQFRGPTDTPHPPSAATSLHPDRAGLDPPAGSSPAEVARRVLDAWGTETALLVCSYASEAVKNPDAAVALSRAVNTWLQQEWLDQEPRLRGSIVVPAGQPQLAAEEVGRVADDRRFVQVLLPARSFAPYGNRIWLPLLEAAHRNELVVALHFGGYPGNPPTAVGWPTTYIEELVDAPSAFQSQLMSLVAEGVFDRFEGLRVICLESGFAWMPSLMWRFDRLWRALRREIPWTRRAPSAYLREHVRLSTQPFDVTGAAELARIVAQLDAPDMLCFATDDPHWHVDDPRDAIPRTDDPSLLRAIMGENARSLYAARL
jgi:predicted TIM-barrel fold metal-dependent hydrolase